MAFLPKWLTSLFTKKKACSANPGTDALMAVIRLIAKASRNSALVLGSGATPAAVIIAYGSLIPDVIKLLSEYDDIPCELAHLNPEAFQALLAGVIAEFGLGESQAKSMIDAAIKLISGVKEYSAAVKVS